MQRRLIPAVYAKPTLNHIYSYHHFALVSDLTEKVVSDKSTRDYLSLSSLSI